jgi:hypothetical protein
LTAFAFDIVRVGEFSGVEVIVCIVRIAGKLAKTITVEFHFFQFDVALV